MCWSPQKVCWILAIMGKGEMIYDIGGGEGERQRHKDITLYKDKKHSKTCVSFLKQAHKFGLGAKN